MHKNIMSTRFTFSLFFIFRVMSKNCKYNGHQRIVNTSYFFTFILSFFLIAPSFFYINSDNYLFGLKDIDDVKFINGDGTIENPYKISNITEINNINSNLSANYILINDIDASMTTFWNNGKGFDPIGGDNAHFTGTLNGNGYSVFNLSINRRSEDNIGLFQQIDGGQVSNLSLLNINYKGNSIVGGIASKIILGKISNCSITGTINSEMAYLGGLSGIISNSIIDNCRVNCTIYGMSYIGGIVGRAEYPSLIKLCSFGNNSIFGFSNIGGISGYNEGIIEFSYALVRITGQKKIGGLIGENIQYYNNVNSGIISFCYANCTIFSADRFGEIGGFIGRNSGDILSSYSCVNIITNINNIGGFIGYQINGCITNCSSSGEVIGSNSVGGFIGSCLGTTIKYCFSKSKINGHNRVGGFIGSSQSSNIIQCYSNTVVIGNFTIGGFIGIYGSSVPGMQYINDSYSDSFVKGNHTVGGFIGRNSAAKINTCYFNGSVSGVATIGGFAGNNTNEIHNCFYLNISIQQGVGEGENDLIEGKNESDLKDINTFTEKNWDINSIWDLVDNICSPYLRWEIFGTIAISGSFSFIIREDSNFSFDYGFQINSTHNVQDIYWKLSTNANWLNLDRSSGTIYGIPKDQHVGTYWINISVKAVRILEEYNNFTIEVLNVNDNPTIMILDELILIEDLDLQLNLTGYDIDPTNDPLVWAIRTNGDFIFYYNDPSRLVFTPLNDDIGIWWVVVNLSDEKAGFDEVNLTLTVKNVNDDPEIIPFDVFDAREDIPFFMHLEATDIDPTGDKLEWSMSTNATFLYIDTVTGNLSGIPTNDDIGQWSVNISNTDGNGGSDWENFILTVLNTNDRPEKVMDQLTLTMEEDSVRIIKDLHEIFIDIDGDTLFFTHDLSEVLDISIEDGLLHVLPFPDWCGHEVIIISASDGYVSISINITVIVTPVNDAPRDVHILAQSFYFEGKNQTVEASATDPDIPFGDELVFVWSSNISGNISVGKSINLSLHAGHHLITLVVFDKEGLFSVSTMYIEIKSNEKDIINGNKDSNIISFLILLFIIFSLIIIFIILIKIKYRSKKNVDKKDEPLLTLNKLVEIKHDDLE